LSYASGAVARERARAKIGAHAGRVKAKARKRKGSREKERKETLLRALPGCLFPRRQGVTGMNPTAFPASLTGRIWFFVELRITNCFRTALDRPVFLSPPSKLVADSLGVRGGHEPQVIHYPHRTFDSAVAGRRGWLPSTDGGAASRSGQSASCVPFPLGGLPRSLADRMACNPVSETPASHGSCHPSSAHDAADGGRLNRLISVRI